MAEITVTDASEINEARRLNLWATALMALAIVAPFFAVAAGYSNAFEAGRRIAYVVFGLAIFMTVAGIATRKGGRLAKAKARLVVGTCLVIGIGGSIAVSVSQIEATKQVVRDILLNETKQAEKFATLAEKFDQVNLEKALTVENMTTQIGIATGKTTLAQYRALLVERQTLLKTNLDESEQLIRSRSPSDDFLNSAMASFTPNKVQAVKMYGDLDRVQFAHADAIATLFEWCSTQVGKLTVNKNQLLFSSEVQKAELAKLVANVQETEDRVNAVVGQATTLQQQAQERSYKSKAEAQKLIKSDNVK